MTLWVVCFLAIVSLSTVTGHGNMVYPPVWMHQEKHIGCGVLDLPTDTEREQVTGKKPDCLNMWYSNNVNIPGEPTISEDMSQPEVTCIGQGGYNNFERKPWQAPGTTPIFGPCGTMGGNPKGCPNRNSTHGHKFGDCCVEKCGGFAAGENAERYEWPGAPITEWYAGSTEKVAWHVSANHAGGYSYRICKMPEGGIGELTEECFQETPLEFVGDEQWVSYGAETHPWDQPENQIKITAKRTTQGTFPPGSMWTLDPLLPVKEEGGSPATTNGHVIDMVKVPDLEPGEYVLSFRWDCKCSSQVWAVCSNIMIL